MSHYCNGIHLLFIGWFAIISIVTSDDSIDWSKVALQEKFEKVFTENKDLRQKLNDMTDKEEEAEEKLNLQIDLLTKQNEALVETNEVLNQETIENKREIWYLQQEAKMFIFGSIGIITSILMLNIISFKVFGRKWCCCYNRFHAENIRLNTLPEHIQLL